MSGRVHGGPDALGSAHWDFSTNANALGPSPLALARVQDADPIRYPDPGYRILREELAAFHAVEPARILLAASASEFIQRLSAVAARLSQGSIAQPALAYGDYAQAAQAWGLTEGAPALRWCAEPGSPLGQDAEPPADPGALPTVLDRVYAPLRLQDRSRWSDAALDQVFQLHSPNKALGLCGVRGAYAIAPRLADWDLERWCEVLRAGEPSWVLGGQGVALLQSWTELEVQAWLQDCLPVLRDWTAALRALLREHGLDPQPSVTPFLCARRPAAAAGWRARGLAVRFTESFGLTGGMRLSAQAPAALDQLSRLLVENLPHE